MTRKLITVTQEDIECGRRGDTQLCPVARALHRHAAENLRVGTYDIFVRTNPNAGSSQTLQQHSRRLVSWIKRFDRLGPNAVKPISFYWYGS